MRLQSCSAELLAMKWKLKKLMPLMMMMMMMMTYEKWSTQTKKSAQC
jgi:hypothetical protein